MAKATKSTRTCYANGGIMHSARQPSYITSPGTHYVYTTASATASGT